MTTREEHRANAEKNLIRAGADCEAWLAAHYERRAIAHALLALSAPPDAVDVPGAEPQEAAK